MNKKHKAVLLGTMITLALQTGSAYAEVDWGNGNWNDDEKRPDKIISDTVLNGIYGGLTHDNKGNECPPPYNHSAYIIMDKDKNRIDYHITGNTEIISKHYPITSYDRPDVIYVKDSGKISIDEGKTLTLTNTKIGNDENIVGSNQENTTRLNNDNIGVAGIYISSKQNLDIVGKDSNLVINMDTDTGTSASEKYGGKYHGANIKFEDETGKLNIGTTNEMLNRVSLIGNGNLIDGSNIDIYAKEIILKNQTENNNDIVFDNARKLGTAVYIDNAVLGNKCTEKIDIQGGIEATNSLIMTGNDIEVISEGKNADNGDIAILSSGTTIIKGNEINVEGKNKTGATTANRYQSAGIKVVGGSLDLGSSDTEHVNIKGGYSGLVLKNTNGQENKKDGRELTFEATLRGYDRLGIKGYNYGYINQDGALHLDNASNTKVGSDQTTIIKSYGHKAIEIKNSKNVNLLATDYDLNTNSSGLNLSGESDVSVIGKNLEIIGHSDKINLGYGNYISRRETSGIKLDNSKLSIGDNEKFFDKIDIQVQDKGLEVSNQAQLDINSSFVKITLEDSDGNDKNAIKGNDNSLININTNEINIDTNGKGKGVYAGNNTTLNLIASKSESENLVKIMSGNESIYADNKSNIEIRDYKNVTLNNNIYASNNAKINLILMSTGSLSAKDIKSKKGKITFNGKYLYVDGIEAESEVEEENNNNNIDIVSNVITATKIKATDAAKISLVNTSMNLSNGVVASGENTIININNNKSVQEDKFSQEILASGIAIDTTENALVKLAGLNDNTSIKGNEKGLNVNKGNIIIDNHYVDIEGKDAIYAENNGSVEIYSNIIKVGNDENNAITMNGINNVDLGKKGKTEYIDIRGDKGIKLQSIDNNDSKDFNKKNTLTMNSTDIYLNTTDNGIDISQQSNTSSEFNKIDDLKNMINNWNTNKVEINSTNNLYIGSTEKTAFVIDGVNNVDIRGKNNELIGLDKGIDIDTNNYNKENLYKQYKTLYAKDYVMEKKNLSSKDDFTGITWMSDLKFVMESNPEIKDEIKDMYRKEVCNIFNAENFENNKLWMLKYNLVEQKDIDDILNEDIENIDTDLILNLYYKILLITNLNSEDEIKALSGIIGGDDNYLEIKYNDLIIYSYIKSNGVDNLEMLYENLLNGNIFSKEEDSEIKNFIKDMDIENSFKLITEDNGINTVIGGEKALKANGQINAVVKGGSNVISNYIAEKLDGENEKENSEEKYAIQAEKEAKVDIVATNGSNIIQSMGTGIYATDENTIVNVKNETENKEKIKEEEINQVIVGEDKGISADNKAVVTVTGNNAKNYIEGTNNGIVADKLANIKVEGNSIEINSSKGTGVEAQQKNNIEYLKLNSGEEKKTRIELTAENIDITGGKYGVKASENSIVNIKSEKENGSIKVTSWDKEDTKENETASIYAESTDNEDAEINIEAEKGSINLQSYNKTVWASGNGGEINIKGENVNIGAYSIGRNSEGQHIAIVAGTNDEETNEKIGKVNVEIVESEDNNIKNNITGDIIGGRSGEVKVENKGKGTLAVTGDILAGNGGAVDISFGNNSFFKGRVDDYQDAEEKEGVENGFYDPHFPNGRVEEKGTVNIDLGEGTVWDVTGQSWITSLDVKGATIDLLDHENDNSNYAINIGEISGNGKFIVNFDSDNL